MIELVSVIKPLDKAEEQKVEAEQPKFTELITSTPTPITTASPESSDAQTGSSFTTSNPNKETMISSNLNFTKSLPLETFGPVNGMSRDPSLPKKKRNAFELEPKTYIISPHCNRALPEGVNYKMITLPDKSPANKKYVELMDKMIQEGPDKHILLAKTSKLELMGIKPEE
ncbi:hypothetical protein Tco_1033020 [Tanacetum coccineum]|uniref:Uncharacterized protein n=1 Tax=Tanacetum coccineum TaxID=301880 RepID=A0ABQ5GDQ6_9ASTR